MLLYFFTKQIIKYTIYFKLLFFIFFYSCLSFKNVNVKNDGYDVSYQV